MEWDPKPKGPGRRRVQQAVRPVVAGVTLPRVRASSRPLWGVASDGAAFA